MCYELHVGCHELRVNWVLVLVWPIGSYAGYGPPPSSCTQRPASNLLSDSEVSRNNYRPCQWRLSIPWECLRLHII